MPVGGFVPPTWGEIFLVLAFVIGLPVGAIIWLAVTVMEWLQ